MRRPRLAWALVAAVTALAVVSLIRAVALDAWAAVRMQAAWVEGNLSLWQFIQTELLGMHNEHRLPLTFLTFWADFSLVEGRMSIAYIAAEDVPACLCPISRRAAHIWDLGVKSRRSPPSRNPFAYE
jgi:hypothetical protein